MLGGLSAVHQFVRIGRHAMIGGMSGVERDVIPYGQVIGDRARLTGLNIIGMQRAGYSREDIQALRTAYQFLFAADGTLSERSTRRPNGSAESARSTTSSHSSAPIRRARSVSPKAPPAREAAARRLPAWARLWQLSDSFVHDGRRPSYHPSAEGSCEPDRVRFTVEIDMNHDSGAIAAVTEPVWLDPLMIEPCTHLRHRVDQPTTAHANFDNVLHRIPRCLGLEKHLIINPRRRRIP